MNFVGKTPSCSFMEKYFRCDFIWAGKYGTENIADRSLLHHLLHIDLFYFWVIFFWSKALSKIWTLLKKLWTTKLCKWIWIKISFKRKNIDSKFLLRDLAGLCYTTCYTWLNPNDFWFIALSEIWTLLKKFQATKLRKKILNSNFI